MSTANWYFLCYVPQDSLIVAAFPTATAAIDYADGLSNSYGFVLNEDITIVDAAGQPSLSILDPFTYPWAA